MLRVFKVFKDYRVFKVYKVFKEHQSKNKQVMPKVFRVCKV